MPQIAVTAAMRVMLFSSKVDSSRRLGPISQVTFGSFLRVNCYWYAEDRLTAEAISGTDD
jgi:predicted DNA-binding ribbon-helix-helix protein